MMLAVSLCWVALLLAPVALELTGRRSSPTRVLAGVARRFPARLVLLAMWAYIGWHLFARYTVPGH